VKKIPMLFALIALLTLSGCALGLPGRVEVQFLNRIAYWDPIEGHPYYRVYEGNDLVYETGYNKTYFTSDDYLPSGEFTVQACTSSSGGTSCGLKSEAYVFDSAVPEQSNVLTITLDAAETFTFYITANVDKLVLRGDGSDHLDSSLVIYERDNPLVIELHDVKFFAPAGKNGIGFDLDVDLAFTPPVLLTSSGTENAVGSMDGDTCSVPGIHGGCGIVVNTLLIQGDADLAIVAGAGAQGQAGEDDLIARGEEGGDGGNGGDGIHANRVLVRLGTGKRLTLYAGDGGAAGIGGLSAAGLFRASDGYPGDPGLSLVVSGIFATIGGSVEDDPETGYWG